MSFDIKIDGIKTFGKHGVYEFEKKRRPAVSHRFTN
jgi:dihydroneopterin aldolase